MSKKLPDEIPTSVDAKIPGMRIAISGTTVGVIVVVALLAMMFIAMKAIDLSDRVTERSTSDREVRP